MYDVIVIGAGPGGNMTALRLAERGVRVAVVDWRQNIGDKLCTGIVGKECAELWVPAPSQVYHAATSATVVSPAGRRYYVARPEPQAYILDRVSYIRSVAERSAQRGADYILGQRVSAIEVGRSGVTVTARQNGSAQHYHAQVAVIAGGFGSPLLRMAGLQNGKGYDFMVGCQVVVEAGELEHTEVYLGSRIAPGSFGWVVPAGGTQALVGLVSRHRLNGQMEGFLSSLQRSGKVRQVVRTPNPWGIPIRPLRKTYASRVLAVGDSAGLVKPITGGGIYYAFRSGEMAAETLCTALSRGDFSSRQLGQYERAWRSLLGRELRIGYYGRVMYESLADDQIERLLADFLSEESQREILGSDDLSFDWHSRAILRAISYRNLRLALTSLGPVVSSMLRRLR